MRIVGSVATVILMLVGLLWSLQGADVISASPMSGQSRWLYIGLALIVAGAVGLWWANARRATGR